MERHEKDVEYYKSQLDILRGDVRVLLQKQAKYDKFMSSYMSKRQSQVESHRETQGPAYQPFLTKKRFFVILGVGPQPPLGIWW